MTTISRKDVQPAGIRRIPIARVVAAYLMIEERIYWEGDCLFMKECPVCGGKMAEIAVFGYECKNCGEIFTSDDRHETRTVTKEEWVLYLDRNCRQN